jgi:hypothetical protein
LEIDTGLIFEGRLFGVDTPERDNQELRRLIKQLLFKFREFGNGAKVVEDLRKEVTTEQLRLMKLASKRLLSESLPAGIEKTLLEYGFTPYFLEDGLYD